MDLRQITAMIGPVELWQAEPKPLLGNSKIETRRQVSANHVLAVLFEYSPKPNVLRAEKAFLWLVPKRKQPGLFRLLPCLAHALLHLGPASLHCFRETASYEQNRIDCEYTKVIG